MEFTSSGLTSNELTGATRVAATSNRSITMDTPGFAASYSALAGYSLADSSSSARFGPSNLQSDGSTPDIYYPSVLFSKVDSPLEDYLALYKVSARTESSKGIGTVKPQYAGNAGWQHSVSGLNGRRTRLDYFAYGPATPVVDMPKTGVVKYSLLGSGNYAADRDLWFIGNLDQVVVDFGAGTISGMVSATGSNFFNGNTGGVFSIVLNGAIVENGVTGPTESGIAVASGQFRLLFVGPHADEMIVTYVGQDGRGTFVGSAAGVPNPYLN